MEIHYANCFSVSHRVLSVTDRLIIGSVISKCLDGLKWTWGSPYYLLYLFSFGIIVVPGSSTRI